VLGIWRGNEKCGINLQRRFKFAAISAQHWRGKDKKGGKEIGALDSLFWVLSVRRIRGGIHKI